MGKAYGRLSLFLLVLTVYSFILDKKMTDNRFAKGWDLLTQIDKDIAGLLIEEYKDISPEFSKYIVEYTLGDIYSRPGLDLKQRQLIAISSLTCLNRLPQLEIHIRLGLKVGLTEQEIVEAILQTTIHAGFPAAQMGLSIARNVFNK